MPAIVRTLGYSFSLSCYRDHRDLHSFPTRRSSDLAAASSLGGPVVVKAQVLTGGRGKAGGVKLAEDPADAEQKAKEIIGLDIRGHGVERVWIETASEIAKEY